MGSDVDLLVAWRDGDQAAGSELFDRHFESIRRFFASKVSSGVEDLVQQTFLACVGARERIRAEGFRAYLFATARSKLYDYLRQEPNRERIDGNVVSVADLGITPSSALAARQDEQLVMIALRRLPIDLQVALELYYFEALRAPELAAVLGIAEGTVRSRVRRGLELLRKHVDRLAGSPEHRKETESTLASWAAKVNEEWARDR